MYQRQAVQVPPVGDVLDVPLLGLCESGQPAEDRLGNRACDSTAERIFLVFGDQSVEFAAQGSCRGLGGDRDDTGRGVLPEQGALRPAQDFDPFDIDQVLETLALTRQHDIIYHTGNARLDAGREDFGSDTADTYRTIQFV